MISALYVLALLVSCQPAFARDFAGTEAASSQADTSSLDVDSGSTQQPEKNSAQKPLGTWEPAPAWQQQTGSDNRKFMQQGHLATGAAADGAPGDASSFPTEQAARFQKVGEIRIRLGQPGRCCTIR